MPKSFRLIASAATFALAFAPVMASAAVHATTHVVAPAPAVTTTATTATTAKAHAKRMTVHATSAHPATRVVATHTTVPATHVVATQTVAPAPAAKPSIFSRMVAAARPAPRPVAPVVQHASVHHAMVPTGRMVTTQTKTGKTVTYNCSKAGNTDKKACKA